MNRLLCHHEGGEGGGGGPRVLVAETIRKPSFAKRYDAPLHIVVPATIHLQAASVTKRERDERNAL